ncbi:hypothetical protein Fmac_026512 [Flemingia macrophylla]|uniref:Uncharacterized protein n=1 Tax=Flemingia macrophylla TaxID=520843 RepID=A0ABD1LFB7_9FABA
MAFKDPSLGHSLMWPLAYFFSTHLWAHMLSSSFYWLFGTPSPYQSSITDLFVSSRPDRLVSSTGLQ